MLKKLSYSAAIIALGVIFGGLIAIRPAQAITLIPPSLEMGLVPGQTIKTSIKLFNETSSAVELYTETQNFTAKGESGQPEFDFNAEASLLSAWLSVPKGPIAIPAGDRYEVPVTITTPKDAGPGGYYAAVFFTSAPPAEGQVRIASKVGTLILAKVEGETKEQGSLVEFGTVTGGKIFNRPPVNLFARFSNTGNVHLRPIGTVTVTNIFGKTIDTFNFNEGKGATLPNSIRKYDIVWEKSQTKSVSGNIWNKFWQEYDNEKHNLGLGHYQVKLSVSAGTNNAVTSTATAAFWLFPWHVIIVWTIALILGIIILVVAIKQYNAWIIKKANK